jgi:hypothetical protein
MEDYDCGVYACMFGDRLSKDAAVTSLSPEEATRNRERLVLSLVERQPLLEYVGLAINEVEQEAIGTDRGPEHPSSVPSTAPTGADSTLPSSQPSSTPTGAVSVRPSSQPSSSPTGQDSAHPSSMPSSSTPTDQDSAHPSYITQSNKPTGQDSAHPSTETDRGPEHPSSVPSTAPNTGADSTLPSSQPSSTPACPSSQPSSRPTGQDSAHPSSMPISSTPTDQESAHPSYTQSNKPTGQDSAHPSTVPASTGIDSALPSSQPSSSPTAGPVSAHPSSQPSSTPKAQDSVHPTSSQPSSTPTIPIKTKDWQNKKMAELKAELRVRNLKLGGKKAELVSRLISSDLERVESGKSEAASPPTTRLSSLELLELQKLQEHLHEIDECVLNLKEYRGHLARHVSEDAYAQSKIDELGDDEAIVTSDYKMKILSCFYRETQKKWFGKRGTNLLGFMITTNSLDEADNLQGVKDVQFVFMVTDDCLTDAWEVVCAKTTLYDEFLPDHVKKVRFWSDGAGCFKSKLHRVFQPFWKHWTGVDEIELRITPAGNGKSQLDGRFGRLNFVLQGAVDEGHSYYDAPTILNAIEHSTGLTATKARTFLPDRSNQVTGDITNVRFESVLLTLLDPNRNEKDSTKVRAFHHSGYGQGQLLDLSERSMFYEVSGELAEAPEDESNKSKKKEKKRVWQEVYNTDVSKKFG